MRHDVFRGDVLDRCGNQRSDATWLATQRTDPQARFTLLWRNRVPMGEQGFSYLSTQELKAAGLSPEEAYFLGRNDIGPYFTLDISALDEAAVNAALPGLVFKDLRMSAKQIAEDDLAILGFAKALTHWQRAHNFCPKCGVPLNALSGGHLLESDQSNCDCKHFPRTDPAVIMIIAADDRALLGRQKDWPPGVYSALAGFVEPGESAEDAVRREVMEETGISVKGVSYLSSQPWPFPGSLMLGFRGEADYAEPVVDKKELDDARWFTREEMAAAVSEGKLILPPPLSIARTLVDDWYQENGSDALKSAFD